MSEFFFFGKRVSELEFQCSKIKFQVLYYLYAPEESGKYNLARFIKGLQSDVWENMSFCQDIQEAYYEAFAVEDKLKRCHMR